MIFSLALSSVLALRSQQHILQEMAQALPVQIGWTESQVNKSLQERAGSVSYLGTIHELTVRKVYDRAALTIWYDPDGRVFRIERDNRLRHAPSTPSQSRSDKDGIVP